MAIYGRVNAQGLIMETCDGDPSTRFHPDLAGEFIELADNAAVGDTWVDGALAKKTVSAPEPEAEVAEERRAPYVEVMNALTRTERIAVKASTDAEVQDLLSQIELNGYLDLENTEDQAVLSGLVADSVISQASLDAINALR